MEEGKRREIPSFVVVIVVNAAVSLDDTSHITGRELPLFSTALPILAVHSSVCSLADGLFQSLSRLFELDACSCKLCKLL